MSRDRSPSPGDRSDPPSDSGGDLCFSRWLRELPEAPWAVPAAIAAGGALGAVSRHLVDLALPHAPGAFAWSTLLVNVSGCLLIGILMVVVAVRPGRRLLRPFVGVGILGGYTTFSTHIIDAQFLLAGGRALDSLLYLGATLAGGLAATLLGMVATRAVLGAAGRRPRPTEAGG